MVAALAVGGISALAIAGTVVYEDNNDWDPPRDLFLNLIDSGGGAGAVLEQVVVEDLDGTGNWYRQPWDGANFAFEVQKDDASIFASVDPCLLDAGNSISDTDTITVNGTQYRAGPTAAGPEESTLPSGTSLNIPGGGIVDEVRFLTSGARIAESSYTITFFYADLTSSVVVVPIPLDSDPTRTRFGADYTVLDWTTPVTSIAGDCAADGANEVLVVNPKPAVAVTDIDFTFDETPTPTGWLAGPLAVTLTSDEPTLESLFEYRGTFKSTTAAASTALDAGVDAAWTDVDWVATFLDGSEIALYVQCGDDTDSDGTLELSELGPEQGPIFLSSGTNAALSGCSGRYAVYRLEYFAEFDPGTAPFLDGITFTFDPDSDGDGDPDSTDCNDGNALIFTGAAEIAGDGVNQDCTPGELCFTDADNDGTRLTSTVVSGDDDCADSFEGVTADLLDCNDGNSGISPLDAEIVSNGIDENCDLVDNCFTDADDDGARLATSFVGNDLDCADAFEGATADPTDCNDGNAGISPLDTDVPDNAIDENCDLVDHCFTDADDDGSRLTTSAAGNDMDCTDAFEGRTADTLDCNDGNAGISPLDADIVDNGIDENCDLVDHCFTDADDDGTRLATSAAGNDLDCLDTFEGRTADLIDCNDGNAGISPLDTDIPDNAIDENCDLKDHCFTDADDDGSRLATSFASNDMDCTDSFEGRTADPIDCNDGNDQIEPGVAEITGDEIDQNCDGNETCWADGDQDGARSSSATVVSVGETTCNLLGESETTDPVDCNDADPARSPLIAEIVGNNVDNNCDGFEECFDDDDNDGARLDTSFFAADTDCTDTFEGEVGDPTDCDDSRSDRSPLLPETTGNEVDNDCLGGETCWLDDDQDGTRSALTVISGDFDCDDSKEGENADLADCDDGNATISPLDPDVCGNGIDDDCDLLGDHATPGALGWLDDDGDGLDFAFESANCTSDCDADTDGDSLFDDEEVAIGTSPCDPDTDGDGFDDDVEVGPDPGNPLDSDGDGLIDALESDDDNDGIPTVVEENVAAGPDFDGDGTPNYLDEDSDDDGHSDAIEWSETTDADGDEDGDGDPDFVDLDSDADEVLDAFELGGVSAPAADTDSDNDGRPNRIDTDDDGDSLPTALEEPESNDANPRNDDFDNDGIADWLDTDDDNDDVPTISEGPSPSGVGHQNTDFDGSPDYLDTDDDNDGVPTDQEDPNGNGLPLDDNTDGDALPNYRDTDDDGDGIATSVETTADFDTDGTDNYLDTDSDNDGYTDLVEGVGNTDGDGAGAYLDNDSDNDEVPDLNELNVDTDSDGLSNRIDPDDDGDGRQTATEEPESNDGNPRNDDWDNDGVVDYLDVDDDGDRVNTLVEGASDADTDGLANYLDTDDDGDTLLTITEDPNGNNAPADDDTDGDGAPNYLDDDDDDDTVPTAAEALQPADPDGDGDANWLDTDSDDDGFDDGLEYFAVADHDFDGDGLEDSVDFDSDGDEVLDAFEQGGVSAPAVDVDTDNDGSPDRIDGDDDADGILTRDEEPESNDANPRNDDWDNDGTPDFRDTDDDNDTVLTSTENYNGGTPQNDDTDGDGIVDYLDVDDDGDEVLTANEVDGGLPIDLDTDGDGTDDYIDDDDDGDSLLTRDEEPVSNDGNPRNDDTDGDGTANFRDSDDDDDGVETGCEVNAPPGDTTDHLDSDTDADTILDGIEWYNFLSPAIPADDYEDLVNDNPSCTPNFGGGFSTGFTCAVAWDRDGDNIPNPLDTDDDGDGIVTALEGSEDLDCGVLPIAGSGSDGIPNWLDYDADNDGDFDCSTGGPDPIGDGDGLNDSDGDTVPDFLDCDNSGCAGDSDADGLTNCDDEEEQPLDPDSDDDGILDGDEVSIDLVSGETADLDTDGDGTPDRLDPDDDGDNIDTVIEVGLGDCPFTLVYNPVTEGWDRVCDTDGSILAFDLASVPNTDADTGGPWPLEPDDVPDYLDDDDDGDGTPSFDEGSGDADGDGLVNYLDPVDFDGPLADADADGLSNEDELALGTDAYDADTDHDGIADADETGDTDGDDIADALDDDDDGDGIPTLDEGDLDLDGDGIPNRLDDDSDGDGVSDADEGAEADSDCDGILDWGDPDDTDGACGAGGDTSIGGSDAGCGGCASTGPAPSAFVLSLAALGLVRRRRSPAPRGAGSER